MASGEEQQPDEEQRSRAAEQLRLFLIGQETYSLKAWLKHFDTNHDGRISKWEFSRALQQLGSKVNAKELFTVLDSDNSHELSLDEIDSHDAEIWRSFRQWCVTKFSSVSDFISKIAGKNAKFTDLAHFQDGLQNFGWTCGNERLLFESLDWNDSGILEESSMTWLAIEHRHKQRKDDAKRRASNYSKKRASIQENSERQLEEFRSHLKRKYGGFVRAWRTVLCPNDTMFLQKAQFMKACSYIGWVGDLKSLWRNLDKDDSGVVSLDEMDPQSAEVLAHFKYFIDENFGDAKTAFRSFDKDGSRAVKQDEFIEVLKQLGFNHAAKVLFHGLASSTGKVLREEDLVFLDRWKPLPYLLKLPNLEAMQQLKDLLLDKYKTFVKAWRQVLDKDASNRCDWNEFQAACKKLSFRGDIAGAWRALDDDLSGFITLYEIDPTSAKLVFDFKDWADSEFGGVRSAFGVFDANESHSLSYTEFRRSCRVYEFDGNTHALFHALDYEHTGSLTMENVGFLDTWQSPKSTSANSHPSKRQSNGSVKFSKSKTEVHFEEEQACKRKQPSVLPQVVHRLSTRSTIGNQPKIEKKEPLPRSIQFLQKPAMKWRLRRKHFHMSRSKLPSLSGKEGAEVAAKKRADADFLSTYIRRPLPPMATRGSSPAASKKAASQVSSMASLPSVATMSSDSHPDTGVGADDKITSKTVVRHPMPSLDELFQSYAIRLPPVLLTEEISQVKR